jgi:hypothetical protein
VRVFDLSDGAPVCEFAVAEDTVNGVHFHPVLPLLATASGARMQCAWHSQACGNNRGQSLNVLGVLCSPSPPLSIVSERRVCTHAGHRRYFLAPDEDGASDDSVHTHDSEDSEGDEEGGRDANMESRPTTSGSTRAGRPRLSPDENALRIWCCDSEALELPGESGAEEEDAGQAIMGGGDRSAVAVGHVHDVGELVMAPPV